MDSLDFDVMERSFQVNSLGPLRVTQALLPNLNAGQGKTVVSITSRLGSIELSTINGSIDSEVTLLSDGTIDITVIDGSINLDIPQNTSATFAAGVIDGAIRLLNLELQDEVRTAHSLTGTLSDGSGDIRLETDIGNITVTGF